jgi:hypothetical protein
MNQYLVTASAAILAAVLTIFGNTYLQNLNYKRDYYKKLLDKRLEAYEKIQDIVNKLGIVAPHPDGLYSFPFASYQVYMELFDEIISSISQGQWVEEDTINIIQELNMFLINRVDNFINENGDKDKQLIKIGIDVHSDLKKIRSRIMASVREDFKNLHNIQRYLNRRKPYRTGFELEVKPDYYYKPQSQIKHY